MRFYKHLTTGFIILICFAAQAQVQKKDSLLRLLNSAAQDTQKVNILCQVSLAYLEINADSSINYALKALSLTDSTTKNKFRFKALHTLGKAYFTKGNFKNAEAYYSASIQNFTGTSGFECAEAQLNKASALAYLGEYPKAISEGLIALKYFERNKNYSMMGEGYNLLGALFYFKKDFKNAVPYYEKAIENFSIANTPSLSMNPLNNLGIIYMEQGKYSLSKEYYLKSLQVAKTSGSTKGISQAYNNLGLLCINTKDYTQALKYYFDQISLAENQHKDDQLANAYINISEVYRLKKQYDQAIAFGLKGQKLAFTSGQKDIYVQTFGNLAEIYKSAGQLEKAYGNLTRYKGLVDTLLTEENSQQINELQTKYETDKKDQQLRLNNIQLREQNLVSEKRSLQRNVLLIFVIFVILILVLLFRVYILKKKDNVIIRRQKAEVEEKQMLLEVKQKEILDSINYAQQIQQTLLANHDLLKKVIPDNFVLFKPKDIVSGDFYWATERNNRFYLAVCDSTGHGVPGAFMSLLNITFLNEAINEKNILEPNEVFDHVRKRLMESISQSGRQDGMDGILLCMHGEEISYAAAQNSPLHISNTAIVPLSADKMPVGKGERVEPFKKYLVHAKRGDLIYLYTDGFADQFGGPKGKKLKYKALHDLLVSHSAKAMSDQQTQLSAFFDEWQGPLEQVDDVCVVGIRIQ